MTPRIDISTWVPHRYLELIRTKAKWTLDHLNLRKWQLYPSRCLPQKCGHHFWHTSIFLIHDIIFLTMIHWSYLFYFSKGQICCSNNSKILVVENFRESTGVLPDSAELILKMQVKFRSMAWISSFQTRVMEHHHHHQSGACQPHGKWQEHKRLTDTYESSKSLFSDSTLSPKHVMWPRPKTVEYESAFFPRQRGKWIFAE